MKPMPIAILCSDLHLSLQAPACRADKNWLDAQADFLAQLNETASGLPVLCAGDIFDRWNASPELINFALRHLPDGMICVPGQHDLPNHNMEEMHRSGYGVLVEAEKIFDLSKGRGSKYEHILGFTIDGFGWNEPITPPRINRKEDLHIALVHKYVWWGDAKYPGAPEEANLGNLNEAIHKYDVAVFGDNHKGFHVRQVFKSELVVFNCGGFIRRKSDEINYKPQIGILYSDGTIKPHYLNTTKDRFHEKPKGREEIAVNMRDFISSLENLGEHGLSFREAVLRQLKEDVIEPETREAVLRALEDK